MIKITIPEADQQKSFVIYTRHLESVNFFLEADLAADEDGGREYKSTSRRSHERRKGPSDQAPVTIPTSAVEYCYDPTLKSGNALGGQSMVWQTDLQGSDIDEQRQFTLVGRTMDFQKWAEGKFTYKTHVHFYKGGRHTFKAAINVEG